MTIMAGRKHSSLDRVLGRLDTLDSVNLSNLVQRLARERGLFETIFNTIHEGILVISAAGVIEYANASAGRLIGLSEEELAGATLWRLVVTGFCNEGTGAGATVVIVSPW